MPQKKRIIVEKKNYDATTMISIFGRRFARNVQTRNTMRTMSTYRMTFVEPSGEEHDVEFMEDDTILDVALDNDIEIEGACGGECACSTCHVILSEDDFDQLPEPDEEEEDTTPGFSEDNTNPFPQPTRFSVWIFFSSPSLQLPRDENKVIIFLLLCGVHKIVLPPIRN